MKKVGFFLISIVLFSGCRDNYLSEKEFYKASRVLAVVKASDVQSRGVAVYDPVIQAFERVAEKYPGTIKASESLLIIARLREKQKDFVQARAALVKVIQNFTGVRGHASGARFRIGRLYELEGRWKEAEETYWETAEYHPLEIKGLYAPIYVITHYQRMRDREAEDKAYQQALDHYKDVLKQVGPIQVSAQVRNYLALAHLTHGDWQKAKDEWLSIAKNMPQNSYAPLSILAVAEISSQKGHPEEAIGLFRQFLKQYPKHPFAGKAAVRLGLLYQDKKQFALSRRWLEKALTRYFAQDKAQSVELRFIIGRSFQDEGNWSEAEKVYREIEAEYPVAIASLQIPLMVYAHYQSIGQNEKAESVLDQAIDHYKSLAKQYPNTKIELYARRFLNSAYAKKGDWNQVLANLDEEIKREKNPIQQGQWLVLEALIAEKRLHNKEKALALYQDFLLRYPQHPLASAAKNHLQILTQT